MCSGQVCTVQCTVILLNDIDSNTEMEARNIYGISAATATIGPGMPLWAGLRQYLLRLITTGFLCLDWTSLESLNMKKIYDLSH